MLPTMTVSKNTPPAGDTIGLLHPGAMGAELGRVLRDAGHQVLWCTSHRSLDSRARAEDAGLEPVDDLAVLVERSGVVISVVPPHAALDVARSVAEAGFDGLYVDANAISPTRAHEIAAVVVGAGATFVDGGIVGPPPKDDGRTWLHLSGPRANHVAALFGTGRLVTEVVSDAIGDASAVKVAFAAWTKGSTALRTAVLAYARTTGIESALEKQWEHLQSGFWEEGRQRAVSVTAKAWRFDGEMREIADAFAALDVPAGFHRTAADVYRSMGSLRNEDGVDVDDVVAAILGGESTT